MASDPERERMLANFRQQQELKEKTDARMWRLPIAPRLLFPLIIAVVVVGALVLFVGIPIYSSFQIVDPAKSFCRLVRTYDDQSAYALLSTSLHHTIDLATFSSELASSHMDDCSTASGVHFGSGNQPTRIDMTFNYYDPSDPRVSSHSTGSLSFVDESAGWRISGIVAPGLTLP